MSYSFLPFCEVSQLKENSEIVGLLKITFTLSVPCNMLNKIPVLRTYLIVVGVHPYHAICSSENENFIIKFSMVAWNIICLTFNFGCWLLSIFRFKWGISTRYSQLAGGVFVNACFDIATIITLSVILLFRSWVVVWCDLVQGGKNSSELKKAFQSYYEFWKANKFLARNRTAVSLNELIYIFVVLTSLVRHCLMVYVQNNIFVLINYQPKPEILPRDLEHNLRYVQELWLDVTTLDIIGLLCIHLVKAVERCISYLNSKVEKSIEMTMRISLFQTDNCESFLRPREILEMYKSMVDMWESMSSLIGRLLFYCFGLWMVILCFNCFFSYTATVDLGAMHVFTFTFHFMVFSTIVKFICAGSSIYTMEYQV